MNNEEKFKKSVKDMLDEPQYSYDAANWEEASRILDLEDSKRKRRFILVWLSGLVIGFGMILYLLLAPEILKQETAHLNKKGYPSEKSSSEKLTGITPGQEKQKSETPTPKKMYTKSLTKPVENSNSQSKPSNFSQTFECVKPKTVSQVPPADLSINASKAHNPLIDIFVKKTTSKETAKDKEEVVKNSYVLPETGKPLDINTSPESGKDSAKNNLLHAVATATLNTLDKKKEEVQKTSEKPDNLEIIKPEDKLPELPIAEIKDSSSKKSFTMQLRDTFTRSIAQPTVQPTAKTNYCYVEAGAYFNLGWKYKNTGEGSGLNPYLGITYVSKVGTKLNFSIGVYYTSLSHLKLDTKVIKSSKVIFGEESNVKAITPVTLNYVSIPLKLQYQIDPVQIITVGYSALYLLDVQSKVETYDEKLNTQTNKKNYQTGGYVEGFKTFNHQLSMGYRRQIYDHLWVNAEVFYGLTDTRDDTFFGINAKERLTGLKISLTYDLLKK